MAGAKWKMEKRKNETAKRTRSLFLSLETPSLFPSFSNPFDACQAGYTRARAPAVGVSIRPRSSPLPRDQWRESEVTARADGCRQHSLTRGPTTTGFPAKRRLRNGRQKYHTDECHYPDLGSSSDWSYRHFGQSEAHP